MFLGGLVLVLALSAYATLRLNVEGTRYEREYLKIKDKGIQHAVAGVSSLALVILVGYAFLENFSALH